MNCKPGEVARIIVPGQFYGRIQICVETNHIGWDGDASWIVDPPLPGYSYVWDSALRPIRDPGDDAVDEMVLLLGAPQEVTA